MEHGPIIGERRQTTWLLEGGIRFFLAAALTASQTTGGYAPFALGLVAAAGPGIPGAAAPVSYTHLYVTRVTLPDGSAYPAVTNVGTRPTVDNGTDVTVEACLLDFDGDLYGETLRLEFFRHIRDEIRFDSLEALKSQIAADAETTRQAFLSGNLEGPPN